MKKFPKTVYVYWERDFGLMVSKKINDCVPMTGKEGVVAVYTLQEITSHTYEPDGKK
jgi:hypothetical protein